jgi:hypothetical protein
MEAVTKARLLLNQKDRLENCCAEPLILSTEGKAIKDWFVLENFEDNTSKLNSKFN